MERGGRGRARGRGRGRGAYAGGEGAHAHTGGEGAHAHTGGEGAHAHTGGEGAHAHTGGARTRGGPTSGAGHTERPSAVDPVYCGMVGELPVGRPLERPLTQRRPRVLPAARRGPVPVSLWSSMDLLTGNHPTQPLSPQEDRAAAAQPAVVDMELCSVPSPALHVEVGGSGTSTPNRTPTSRKRNASDHNDMGAKRRLITSSSSSSRPLRDIEISNALNYGSDEDSEEDGEEEIGLQSTIVPRVVQMFAASEDEGEGGEVDAFISFSWPPTSNDHPPVPNSSGPIPSTSHVPDYSVPPSLPTHTPSSPSCPMSEPGNKFDFKWRGFPQPQTPPELRREPFSQINCGPTVPYASPYDAFTAIWDRDIMEHIAMETNRYAQQLATVMLVDGSLCPSSRITKWKDTDVSELHVYFAIILATGIVVKSRLEEYWNSTLDIFSTPGFTAAMTYDRFMLLSKCLHFQDNDGCDPELMTRAQAKLFKVQPILDHLNNKFQQLYVLGQNVSVDESLTMWKGWLDINQFIRNKAATVGIKTYEVCESQTGYL